MSSFSFKDCVETKNVHPKIVRAWWIVAELSEELGIDTVVTSVGDGKHSPNSFHYTDPVQASDFRTWYLPTDEDKANFVKELRVRLGSEYDVILEKTHLHIEFDDR